MQNNSNLDWAFDLEVWQQAYNHILTGAVIALANGVYWSEADTRQLADQALAAYKTKMAELQRKETNNETHIQPRIPNPNPDQST